MTVKFHLTFFVCFVCDLRSTAVTTLREDCAEAGGAKINREEEEEDLARFRNKTAADIFLQDETNES